MTDMYIHIFILTEGENKQTNQPNQQTKKKPTMKQQPTNNNKPTNTKPRKPYTTGFWIRNF